MSYTRQVVFSANTTMRQKIRLVAAMLAWLAAFLLPLHAQLKIQKFQGKDVAASQVLVQFRTPGLQTLASARSAGDIDSYREVGAAGIFVMHSRSLSTASLVTRFGARKDVVLVEPDYILHAAELPDDPEFPNQYALLNSGQTILGAPGAIGADIGAATAWGLGTGTAGHTVAVIDTGADSNHPDLASNLWTSATGFSVQLGRAIINCPAGTRGFNTIKRTCDALDDNSHGTHLAGIIGASGDNATGISGVNWTTSVLPVKFLDAKGTGTTSNAIDAIEFVIQVKQASQANVRVINASWGDAVYSKALMQAVERAFQNNILFVASAGNTANNNDAAKAFYPASFAVPNVISVASTNHQDGLDPNSNFGATSVHLGAPGAFILSTVPGGGYDYSSGTSMAAAYVSGAAALALSICPDLGTADLRGALLQGVVPIAALVSKTSTQGRLNVGNTAQACHGPAFALTASPQSISVARGDYASVAIQVSAVNGYNGNVNLQISGLPAGASADSATVNTSGAASLTITVADNVAVGTYALTVLGSDGSLVRSTPVWMDVTRRTR